MQRLLVYLLISISLLFLILVSKNYNFSRSYRETVRIFLFEDKESPTVVGGTRGDINE